MLREVRNRSYPRRDNSPFVWYKWDLTDGGDREVAGGDREITGGERNRSCSGRSEWS